MQTIRLLYAKHTLYRERGCVQQCLVFSMIVKHLAFEKLVEVHWSGQDGIWHILKASYMCPAGEGHEIWRAWTVGDISEKGTGVPGNVKFALRYHVAGKTYWDNNHFQDYFIETDSGVLMGENFPILNIDSEPELAGDQEFCCVAVAVRHALLPRSVYVHWSTDHWRNTHVTHCCRQREYGHKALGSNAGNPNQYGCEIWSTSLHIGDAYRVEYAVACDASGQTLWDNNLSRNHLCRHERLKVLTLNLHCYQEKDQDAKFRTIAKAINDLKVDIVCFQEVGEPWNDGHGNWNSNAAKIVRDQLEGPYHLYTDWSHLGFDRFREGSAIISRFPLVGQESRYVSPNRDVYDIHARKVVMVRVLVPHIGFVNVFCVHLSWWKRGFREQFKTLRGWSRHSHSETTEATLLCGDFNNPVGSSGYLLVARDHEDPFEEVQSADQLATDQDRIDFVFLQKGSNLQAISARVLFTDADYGRVSDHYGYYVDFEPK
jgi:maltose 6'-phosphate phosphatase